MGRSRGTPSSLVVEREIIGRARVGSDPLALARRVQPGDIAVIDAADLGQRAAGILADRRPGAVVNAQQSISGRFPNRGPLVLAEAGILLIDAAGPAVLGVRDGAEVRIADGALYVRDIEIAHGEIVGRAEAMDQMAAAKAGMAVQLASFTASAMDTVTSEADALLEGAGLPDPGVDLTGRHVVIVAPGHRHRNQLRAIRPYLREHRPIMIAIDEAADAVAKLAYAPAVVVGSVEHVSEATARGAAAVVAHSGGSADSHSDRLDTWGVSFQTSESRLASADLAMLIAHAGGAAVIVTVGVEVRLLDFLEEGRSHTAGTLLARLQAGPAVIDAVTLAKVHRHRFSRPLVAAFVLSSLLALVLALVSIDLAPAWLTDTLGALGEVAATAAPGEGAPS